MKKITLTLGVVALFSSCGIQFGNYERYKQVHKSNMCQNELKKEKELTQDEYYDYLVTTGCENCDEID